MKIAFLILAHGNYWHLERLLGALAGFDGTVFVHLDKRALKPQNIDFRKAVLLKNRISVYWGGFSMVRATMNLLRCAMEVENFDYFILLSGADYPIRPASFLLNKLSTGGEFINVLPAPQPSKPWSRFENWHFDGFDRRSTRLPEYALLKLEGALRRCRLRRSIPFPVFVGSQWFALSHDCVRYILTTEKTAPGYNTFFKYCLIPDEAYFQTIISHSPFASRVRNNLTYTDWSTDPAPAILDIDHIELLRKQKTFPGIYGPVSPFFARKFNDNSLPVVQLIDRELRMSQRG